MSFTYDYGRDGCEVAERCLDCPLIACRFDYEAEVKGAERPLDLAIKATWDAGIYPETAWGVFKGRREVIRAAYDAADAASRAVAVRKALGVFT